jgi:hypothetical protein
MYRDRLEEPTLFCKLFGHSQPTHLLPGTVRYRLLGAMSFAVSVHFETPRRTGKRHLHAKDVVLILRRRHREIFVQH